MEDTEKKPEKKSPGLFKCEIPNCEKVFKRSNDLKRHLQSHRDERNFACTYPDCDKTFTRRSTLNKHLARHKSPKQKKEKAKKVEYICKHCSKKFKRFHDLDRHERKHIAQTPFPCYFPGCNKTFRREYNAKFHMQNQHGVPRKFECHDCGKKYGKKFDLAKHIQKHMNRN